MPHPIHPPPPSQARAAPTYLRVILQQEKLGLTISKSTKGGYISPGGCQAACVPDQASRISAKIWSRAVPACMACVPDWYWTGTYWSHMNVSIAGRILRRTRIPDHHTMLAQCWASVADAGPAFKQHWMRWCICISIL